MLHHKQIRLAAKVAEDCIARILFGNPNGEAAARSPQEIALIGELISVAISATQPQNLFESISAMTAKTTEVQPDETSSDTD